MWEIRELLNQNVDEIIKEFESKYIQILGVQKSSEL